MFASSPPKGDRHAADDVIDRMRQALGAESDGALARALGHAKTTVSSWRRRRHVPYADCVALAGREVAALDWLLTGRGPQHRRDYETRVRELQEAIAAEVEHRRTIARTAEARIEHLQQALAQVTRPWHARLRAQLLAFWHQLRRLDL